MKDTYRILAKDQKVSNNTWVTGLNNNDIIIGSSGAGKTRGYVIPNLLQCSESMIVSDTKGNVKDKVWRHLKDHGYDCQCIDFTGKETSCGYNPFDYIKYDKAAQTYSVRDIKTVATGLVPIEDKCQPFWEYAARMYLESLIAYTLECLPRQEHDLSSVVRLFGLMGDPRFDRLFYELSEMNPESYAVQIYDMYKRNERAEKMHESIRGILAEKIHIFGMDEVKGLFHRRGRMDFSALGQKKTAVFLTISDTDRSMDRLANLFYTQALHELCESADRNDWRGQNI